MASLPLFNGQRDRSRQPSRQRIIAAAYLIGAFTTTNRSNQSNISRDMNPEASQKPPLPESVLYVSIEKPETTMLRWVGGWSSQMYRGRDVFSRNMYVDGTCVGVDSRFAFSIASRC
jgi:hypothetical protein